jgi:hypothetical protein
MTAIWKGDLFRFVKSKLFYGVAVLTCLIACSLMILTRQDIQLGISIFGNLTAFKTVDDIIRIGVQYQKGLGILVAVLLSVFIGQEYAWKTWQHKWIIGKSRPHIYASKALLSSVVSTMVFLIFEVMALLCSCQIQNILTDGYVAMVICSAFIYAALGSVICMLSVLIKSNTASIIICLGYVLFSETMVSIIKGIGGITEITASLSEWITGHSICGMSMFVCGSSVSYASILPIFINSVAIILLSTATGLFFFRKYEL